ncbi:hypothetical protein C8R43DRAFT_1108721, partial [Mycena crocata]
MHLTQRLFQAARVLWTRRQRFLLDDSKAIDLAPCGAFFLDPERVAFLVSAQANYFAQYPRMPLRHSAVVVTAHAHDALESASAPQSTRVKLRVHVGPARTTRHATCTDSSGRAALPTRARRCGCAPIDAVVGGTTRFAGDGVGRELVDSTLQRTRQGVATWDGARGDELEGVREACVKGMCMHCARGSRPRRLNLYVKEGAAPRSRARAFCHGAGLRAAIASSHQQRVLRGLDNDSTGGARTLAAILAPRKGTQADSATNWTKERVKQVRRCSSRRWETIVPPVRRMDSRTRALDAREHARIRARRWTHLNGGPWAVNFAPTCQPVKSENTVLSAELVVTRLLGRTRWCRIHGALSARASRWCTTGQGEQVAGLRLERGHSQRADWAAGRRLARKAASAGQAESRDSDI